MLNLFYEGVGAIVSIDDFQAVLLFLANCLKFGQGSLALGVGDWGLVAFEAPQEIGQDIV